MRFFLVTVGLVLMLAACGSGGTVTHAPQSGVAVAPAAAPASPAGPEDVALAIADALIVDDLVTVMDLFDPALADRADRADVAQNWLGARLQTNPYQRTHLGPVLSRAVSDVEQHGATTVVTVALTHQHGAANLVVTLAETPDGWRARDCHGEITKKKDIP